VKCWNFRKADWKRFCLLTGESVERLPPAVNSINFSHSSRKAFTTINKLTGRSGRSSRLCPISANSIALQLVKNGAHKTGRSKSARLINKELSELWKVPIPEGNSVSVPLGRGAYFRPQAPEAMKVSGSGFYIPGVYTPLRVDSKILVLRLPHFLHAPTQNSQDLEKSTNSCDP